MGCKKENERRRVAKIGLVKDCFSMIGNTEIGIEKDALEKSGITIRSLRK